MGKEEREQLHKRFDELLTAPIPGEGYGGPARQVHLMVALGKSVLLLDETNERLSTSSEKLTKVNIWLTLFVIVLAFVQVGIAVFQFLLPLATK
jgi:hypothetical protein